MTHEEIQQAATEKGVGRVHFQHNVARNTGREFEVGYVFLNGRRVLFCKRQPTAASDAFYLCNEFRPS